MDAPKGRYRVVEKDGRLIVIDNRSGSPVSPSMPPPRASGVPASSPPRASGGPGASSPPRTSGRSGASPPPIIAAGEGLFDGIAGFLLTLAAQDWDKEGRAIIHWKWEKDGKEVRWDAALDKGQQRRLGRGLLGFCAAPLAALVLIFVDLDGLTLPFLALAALPVIRGVWTINRLMAEADPPPDDPG